MAQTKLERPEKVGDISVAEATEIKALNKLINQLSDDATKAQFVLEIAQRHRGKFLEQLILARELPLTDLYSINDDSGQILRTHSVIDDEIPTG